MELKGGRYEKETHEKEITDREMRLGILIAILAQSLTSAFSASAIPPTRRASTGR